MEKEVANNIRKVAGIIFGVGLLGGICLMITGIIMFLDDELSSALIFFVLGAIVIVSAWSSKVLVEGFAVLVENSKKDVVKEIEVKKNDAPEKMSINNSSAKITSPVTPSNFTSQKEGSNSIANKPEVKIGGSYSISNKQEAKTVTCKKCGRKISVPSGTSLDKCPLCNSTME